MLNGQAMPPRHDIVASVENNHYMAWQAMLFHYSCLKHMGCAPLVVVHSDDSPLLPGFQLLQQKGGRVQQARNFRHDGRAEYSARNTAGTLLCARSDADYLVLCDADMLFLRSLPLSRYCLSADCISFDCVEYLRVADDIRPCITDACRRAGLTVAQLEASLINGGVPHIVPKELQHRLSREWLRCMEFFFPSRLWEVSMWALVLAVRRLGIEPVMTRFCVSNFEGSHRPEHGADAPHMIHYCYGDAEFNKRGFLSASGARESVWQIETSPGTVNGLIGSELRAAAAFYGIASGAPVARRPSSRPVRRPESSA